MQEDNMDKWLASSLRQAQEESPPPYQEGAWETFEKRRKAGKIRTLTYWVSGVAASLLVLLLAFNALDFSQLDKDDKLSSTQKLGQSKPEEAKAPNSQISTNPGELNAAQEPTQLELLADKASVSPKKESSGKVDLGYPKELKAPKAGKVVTESGPSQKENINLQPLEQGSLAALSDPRISNEQTEKITGLTALTTTQSDSAERARVELLKKQIAELTGANEDEPKKAESSPLALALGLSPGFGATEQDEQQVSGSSVGLGVQMNLALGDKFVLGSGMGVNYYSHSSTGPSVVRIANAAYPVNEKVDVQQVQVDIPLYVSYPITKSKSIALQAGFSNLVAFNQGSQKELAYNRQVTVVDDGSSLASSFTFQSESVSSISTIDAPSSKFYPFATANLGLNIRVMESDKTSYFLMPFYNYPIQDVSGTGSNIGFFGAALKVNFGAIQKK